MSIVDLQVARLRKKLPTFLTNPDSTCYLSNNYVVLDFETTNLDNGSPYNPDNSLVCGGWILGTDHPLYTSRTVEYRWGTEFDFGEVVNACEQADFIVAHNAKFELGWLARCGLDISKVLPFCTQLAEYVWAGNRKMRFNLESSLQRWGLGGKFSLVSKLIANGVSPEDIDANQLERYGKIDVIQAHKLFLKQRARLRRSNLLDTFLTHNIFTAPLVEIERNGMHLDEDRVERVYRTFMQQRAELQVRMDKLAKGVNFRSGKQMAELLYRTLKFKIPTNWKDEPLVNKPSEAWPDGVPKTDKTTIAKLKARNAVQREFLEVLTEIKKIDSSITKFIGKFHQCVEETPDNILYAKMNQTTTRTHRLSSSGLHYAVQFHNLDRRFKPLFTPRYAGWNMGEADEAQLEYRTAVWLGRDETGLQDILDHVDAHSITASIIFKEQWEECGGDKKTSLGKYVRTESKPHTFKPLYGGTSGTEREKEYYQFFQDKHVGITQTQNDWKDKVYRHKKLVTPTGLTFYWEDCKLNRRGTLIRPDGRPADQSICNYPVQNLATGEIVPIGVTFLYHYMKAAEMESFLVNTIHDSAIGEIHPLESELFKKLAVQSMEKEVITYLKSVYDMDFDVPLEAEVELNSHWANSESWEQEYLHGTEKSAA